MSRLKWDQAGERFYETGVDRGVLYIQGTGGIYEDGEVWNGLVSVSENPDGAEPNPQYADNIKYLNLISIEELKGTIEAFTYPDSFAECDGTYEVAPGMRIGQQPRKTFGLSYRTILGNDEESNAHGYKLHMIYGAVAQPSEKSYETVNDSPEALTFSWEFETTPVDVEGFQPTALVTVSSLDVEPAVMKELEDLLYGTADAKATLPLPDEIADLLNGD